MHHAYHDPDLPKLQATMQSIELACSSIQMHINPAAAEATILSLCQSPQPYKACQFILDNSEVPNARFQAATAIRDAAIREWGFLTADDKIKLISYCLNYVMQHASSKEGYVQAKVSSVATQLMKRGWLEFQSTEKDAFFQEVRQAVIGSRGLHAQFIGITVLESLVSEFAPSTSTALGLPREFHEQCRASLEINYLKTMYCWAQEAALSVTNNIVQSDSEILEVKVCTAALRLMLQILNWEFQYNTSALEGTKKSINVFSSGVRFDVSSAKRSDYALVQPGPPWRDVLIHSGHVGWLLSLYGALRLKFSNRGYWLDCPIAVSARKLIVQLCSLTGAVFPSDSGLTQKQHLLQLLSGIMQWIEPPDVVSNAIKCGRSESEMLDGCRAILSVASVTTSHVFDQLLKSIRPFGTISLLSALMAEVVKDLMDNSTDEETWSWVARDILLDTWTTLLVPTDYTDQSAMLPPEGINAAANLFALIVESELKAASASVSSDETEDCLQASIAAMDERLSSYALIAREAVDVTIPLLTRLFSERFSRLHQNRGASDPTETLEELFSLLLIAGHVLSDEGQGETPLVPRAMQTQFVGMTEVEKHPAVILSSSIIKFAEQSLDPEMRASFFSPRLMEAIIWFLARWSSTYLMPSNEMNKGIRSQKVYESDLQPEQTGLIFLSLFGEQNQGKYILEIVVRIAMTTLISYPGENDLQALTCYQLLHGLVRRKNVSAQLASLESWRDLASIFAGDKKLFSLNTAHQRSLSQTLVVSASGIGNVDAANQYVRDLTSHMTRYLVEVSGRSDLKNVAQQPDVILGVTCLLERLRGASSASEPRTQKAIFEMGLSVMNPITKLLEVYKNESTVIYLLLKFVVDWVDGQIIYLEAQETAIVVNFCMRLLQLYSSYNIGKISLSLSSSLLSEANIEKYKDLRALLQLLSNLCSKDLVDFSSDSIEAHGTSISQVVYTGLHIVNPLITLDMLKYPRLCHDDAEVVDMCLRALKALASYHFKETASGKVGFGPHASGYKDLNGKMQEGILSQFTQLLLQFLLFEDYSTDLVSSAADALLPLILCEQVLYQRLGNELIERQANPVLRLRLGNALQSLTSSNNLSFSLDRPNYQKFRKNLHSFLIEVRGFLRTI
ncbi:hypothetical protein AgCh_025241 [Apium graveolens]